MPQDLTLKIAAGEVVERPASAVRELIDNALDAGATSIKVEIRDAGMKLIRVTDNGHGIARDDLPLAFARHATSKITCAEDLSRLSTLGFRGEALASIAAVARVEIATRTADEEVGWQMTVGYGEAGMPSPVALSRGCRVAVHDLFVNVPARRAFVRSLRSEAAQVGVVVSQYSLAHPDVRFTFLSDGKSVLAAPGTGHMLDAVTAVYGAGAASHLRPVFWEENGISVTGLVSEPSYSRSHRSAIILFVNGRPVGNRSLPFALEEAYSGYLMVGRHPMALVHLRIPPESVDPNVHPGKSEVRFAREREVHGALYRAVANTLLDLRLEPRPLVTEPAPHTFDVPDTTPTPTQPELIPAENEQPAPPSIPALRVFGQTNATYILAEGPNGLYMIDQHAAHERILFDQLMEDFMDGEVPSQRLLEPASIDLSPGQMRALEENGDLLRQAGFWLEGFGDSACLVRAVPVMARGAGLLDLVVEVLEELQNVPEPSAAWERALAMMACKAAVKAGQTLVLPEMRELVTQLEATPRPNTCPHGRPTMIHLSHTMLEREFGRR